MKFRFAIVELGSAKAGDDAAIANRILSLKNAQTKARTLANADKSAPRSGCYSLKAGQLLPDEIGACEFAILCGSCDSAELQDCCKQLNRLGISPIVIIDAFQQPETLAEAFSSLELGNVQLAKTAGAISTLKSEHGFIYPYAKPDCTATVCLFFDKGKSALVIERKHDPFKGKNAFPGGFLRVMLETIEESARREVEEECSLKLYAGELILVDVRSAPNRDPRAHVVDTGFAALIDDKRKTELVPQLKAADDAEKAQLVPVAELLASGMAFDHHALLLASLARLDISSS